MGLCLLLWLLRRLNEIELFNVVTGGMYCAGSLVGFILLVLYGWVCGSCIFFAWGDLGCFDDGFCGWIVSGCVDFVWCLRVFGFGLVLFVYVLYCLEISIWIMSLLIVDLFALIWPSFAFGLGLDRCLWFGYLLRALSLGLV